MNVILNRTNCLLKSLFCYIFKLNYINSYTISIDFIFLNKFMKFYIEYFMILICTIENQIFQFFEKFNLNFCFIFVIALNKQL